MFNKYSSLPRDYHPVLYHLFPTVHSLKKKIKKGPKVSTLPTRFGLIDIMKCLDIRQEPSMAQKLVSRTVDTPQTRQSLAYYLPRFSS